ncbi:MAG TPA: alpha/beta fold hydrolase [Candidatus Deferrimicrobium sp.]|nr:alpha/beta fold hydrolase [Candidatus Deferrimicrobium sp.]
MYKLSRQTRETIKTIAVLLVVALLVVAYIIYPLNRVKASMARANIDDYENDSLHVNDVSAWVNAGMTPDTFRVESDGLTTLACLHLAPSGDTGLRVRGTVILVHDETTDRNCLLPTARALIDSGYAVIVFDQRACGQSTGKYHGAGQYEATDLLEVIRYADMRGQITHPLLVIGFALGADAALLAAGEDKRIDAVMAVNPYLSVPRWQDAVRKRLNMFSFPFFRTIMWWWYEIRSGYAAEYRQVDDIKPVACRTLLLTAPDAGQTPEIRRLVELSPELLRTEAAPVSEEAWFGRVLAFAAGGD